MASEFSSNIRQIAAELKETNARTAAGVRRAIRKSVGIAALATNDAIKAAAEGEELHKAAAATSVKVSFSVRSGGATIRTDQNQAPYARPLENGSKGSGGQFNRHPVYGHEWRVDQPVRPFFFRTALAMEPLSEATMNAALDVALQEAGWVGVQRSRAAAGASLRRRATQAAKQQRSTARRRVREAEARQREFHRVFGTREQKAAVRRYDAAQEAKRVTRQRRNG